MRMWAPSPTPQHAQRRWCRCAAQPPSSHMPHARLPRRSAAAAPVHLRAWRRLANRAAGRPWRARPHYAAAHADSDDGAGRAAAGKVLGRLHARAAKEWGRGKGRLVVVGWLWVGGCEGARVVGGCVGARVVGGCVGARVVGGCVRQGKETEQAGQPLAGRSAGCEGGDRGAGGGAPSEQCVCGTVGCAPLSALTAPCRR
eukprot:363361-Chlamydomonas_euryale.AAC.4